MSAGSSHVLAGALRGQVLGLEEPEGEPLARSHVSQDRSMGLQYLLLSDVSETI